MDDEEASETVEETSLGAGLSFLLVGMHIFRVLVLIQLMDICNGRWVCLVSYSTLTNE